MSGPGAVYASGCSEQFSIGFTGIVNSLLDGNSAPLRVQTLLGGTSQSYATAWIPDGYLPGTGYEMISGMIRSCQGTSELIRVSLGACPSGDGVHLIC